MSLLDGETDVEDPRSFATLSPPNQLVASPRWAQQYEVVVATSAIICKKGFAPHTGAREALTHAAISGVHEVFVALEMERLCKSVSLVMFVPGEHYISGALQAQSSSAYSSSTDEG